VDNTITLRFRYVCLTCDAGLQFVAETYDTDLGRMGILECGHNHPVGVQWEVTPLCGLYTLEDGEWRHETRKEASEPLLLSEACWPEFIEWQKERLKTLDEMLKGGVVDKELEDH